LHYARVTVIILDMRGYLTIADAAKEIGVSNDTIRRWEKKGLIKATRNEKNYRVFNIEEIKRLYAKVTGKTSGKNHYKILKEKKQSTYTSIDLFAGAGGTALGLEHAGFQHLMLNEFDKDATATLRANRPGWHIIEDDIAKVNFSPYEGQVDVLEGGFPCQAFSYAGRKLGFEDTRGTLFYQFARAVKEVSPKIVVGENVRGLSTHDGGRTLQTMVSILQELGYKVAYKILRSQYLDVPQKRERLLIFGIRDDIKLPILFPKEKDYTISLREAFTGCPESPGQEYSDYKKKIMKLIPPGGYWRDLPLNIQKEYMKTSFHMGGGKTGMARRLSWDEPSLTLTCNPAQKQTERCHPEYTRPLTIREYARIQTFPDNWEFVGSVTSQYKQIGNAVPVNLGYHIGLAVRTMLDSHYKLQEFEVTEPQEKIVNPQLQLAGF
jgi:DNA (cytosine-5)-methyltransferase 1